MKVGEKFKFIRAIISLQNERKQERIQPISMVPMSDDERQALEKLGEIIKQLENTQKQNNDKQIC